jgi:hypothetical protein
MAGKKRYFYPSQLNINHNDNEYNDKYKELREKSARKVLIHLSYEYPTSSTDVQS